MTIPADLLDLAPATLTLTRNTRFDGSGFDLPLDRFTPAERDGLARLYAAVDGLSEVLDRARADPDLDAARGYLLGLDADALVADAHRVGAGLTDSRTRKLLHDVRGGGLTVLVGTADLLRAGVASPALVRGAMTAARDHARIMRTTFPELDPAGAAADERARAQDARGLVAGWDGLAVARDGHAVGVEVRYLYDGAITARPREAGAMARVLYNYLNNAVRFSAGPTVVVWVFAPGPGLVRWVVENAVGGDDAAWLRAGGDDLKGLYAGGQTRGGHGEGLSACAEIAAACFGVTPAEAVRDGHLGAKLDGVCYKAWFHWPTADPTNPDAPSPDVCQGLHRTQWT